MAYISYYVVRLESCVWCGGTNIPPKHTKVSKITTRCIAPLCLGQKTLIFDKRIILEMLYQISGLVFFHIFNTRTQSPARLKLG